MYKDTSLHLFSLLQIYANMLKYWNIDRKARPTFAEICAFLDEQAHDEEAAQIVAVSDIVDEQTPTDENDPGLSGYGLEKIE